MNKFTSYLRSIKTLSLALLINIGVASPSQAAFVVYDPRALQESMYQRVLAVEQWAKDNLNFAKELKSLDLGNDILNQTQNLMADNFKMQNKQTWQKITNLQEQSLALLHASKASWQEFGSANAYYASFLKAQAWEECMQSKHCSFQQAVQKLENSSINQAIQASKNAQAMNDKLNYQIQQLQSLNQESSQTLSQAATLDALSKINGAVASSMIDLNGQIATLTQLQSHMIATNANQRLAKDAYFNTITTQTINPPIDLPHNLP